MSWFHHEKQYAPPPGPPPQNSSSNYYAPPPGPPPAPPSFDHGHTSAQHYSTSINNAPANEADNALRWFQMQSFHEPQAKLLDSDSVQTIRKEKAGAWSLSDPTKDPGWVRTLQELTDPNRRGADISVSKLKDGLVQVISGGGRASRSTNPFHARRAQHERCRDLSLLSTFPLLGGQYRIPQLSEHWKGVYYEVTLVYMKPAQECASDEEPGSVAIGTSRKPYPPFRLPGWNYDSFAWHADDSHAFAAQDDGGQQYPSGQSLIIQVGDTVGVGLDVSPNGFAHLFFTHTRAGYTQRLPILTRNDGSPAYVGWNRPEENDGFDIYANVGVCGAVEIHVNFGSVPFQWPEANQPGLYQLASHIGVL